MELRRYRLLLDPASPFGTPPTSGTLFGHLAWAKRRRQGREALRAWLARLPAEPFALSDLLPADHLPRPLLAPLAGQAPKDAKALKRLRYLPLSAWKRLRAGATAAALTEWLRETEAADLAARAKRREAERTEWLRETKADPIFLEPASLPHNRIDRATGRTPAVGGGGLWFAEELWPSPPHESAQRIEADLYIRSSLSAAEVEALLVELGETGFGRDAALGRGRFRVEGGEAMAWLDEAPAGAGAPRRLSLSQGVITANMLAARWQRFVLFGKVGREMMAEGKRPWKLPLLLAEAGATFTPADTGPYGAWVTGLHQDDDPADPIGHNAFHLAIPYKEAQ